MVAAAAHGAPRVALAVARDRDTLRVPVELEQRRAALDEVPHEQRPVVVAAHGAPCHVWLAVARDRAHGNPCAPRA